MKDGRFEQTCLLNGWCELFKELCIETEIGDLMSESTFFTTSKEIHLPEGL